MLWAVIPDNALTLDFLQLCLNSTHQTPNKYNDIYQTTGWKFALRPPYWTLTSPTGQWERKRKTSSTTNQISRYKTQEAQDGGESGKHSGTLTNYYYLCWPVCLKLIDSELLWTDFIVFWCIVVLMITVITFRSYFALQLCVGSAVVELRHLALYHSTMTIRSRTLVRNVVFVIF